MEIKPEIVNRVMTHTNAVVAVRFNKSTNQVVTMSQDGTMFIWLIESGQKVKSFNELHGAAEMTGLEFDEQFSRMYTASTDGSIKVAHYLINFRNFNLS
jgi:WD40 repeat protein